MFHSSRSSYHICVLLSSLNRINVKYIEISVLNIDTRKSDRISTTSMGSRHIKCITDELRIDLKFSSSPNTVVWKMCHQSQGPLRVIHVLRVAWCLNINQAQLFCCAWLVIQYCEGKVEHGGMHAIVLLKSWVNTITVWWPQRSERSLVLIHCGDEEQSHEWVASFLLGVQHNERSTYRKCQKEHQSAHVSC